MEFPFNAQLWQNGPIPGELYNFPGTKANNNVCNGPRKHTQSPVTTGTSVLGIKFNGGVVIAADMVGSYGSLARFKNVSRILRVNENTVIGAGGDIADFQHLSEIINQKVIDEDCLDDGFKYGPMSIYSWLTRVMYNRRSRFDPLWNTCVVAGIEHGQPFLGYVDKIGVAYQGDTIATGYGSYIALPLMRKASEENPQMTETQAVQVLDRCLKILYYRDARSLNKYEIAVVTKDGAVVKGPMSSQTDWTIGETVRGYE